MTIVVFIIGIVALSALIVGLIAFQSVLNWERQMRMELNHQEKRIDNLMELVRTLNRCLNN
jgi:hypothetical protein